MLFKYTPDASSHVGVATSDASSHDGVATTDSSSHDGVATTDSSSHDGVATTDSSSHDGVATTDRYSNKCWRQQCSKYQPLTQRIPSRVGWYVVVRHLVEQEKVALMALALIQEVLPTLASFPAPPPPPPPPPPLFLLTVCGSLGVRPVNHKTCSSAIANANNDVIICSCH